MKLAKVFAWLASGALVLECSCCNLNTGGVGGIDLLPNYGLPSIGDVIDCFAAEDIVGCLTGLIPFL